MEIRLNLMEQKLASIKSASLKLTVLMTLLILLSAESTAKISENKTNINITNNATDNAVPRKTNGISVMLFADELKETLDKYLFGICPPNSKVHWSSMGLNPKGKNSTGSGRACDPDAEQRDLAGRLAALALRAHSVSRTECLRFGSVLANTLGELARSAANKNAFNTVANNEPNKKRKLSKSQKLKIQAKQKTALAVKKKAAAVAAAAAAKMTS